MATNAVESWDALASKMRMAKDALYRASSGMPNPFNLYADYDYSLRQLRYAKQFTDEAIEFLDQAAKQTNQLAGDQAGDQLEGVQHG